MSGKVVVAGVGMIPFTKPGRSEPYDVMGAEAARRASPTRVSAYEDVQQAYAGYVYGDSTSGQRAIYHLGHDRRSPSSTSTTTARPGRPRCFSPARRSRAASPMSCWRWASSRWSRARSARSSPTGPTSSAPSPMSATACAGCPTPKYRLRCATSAAPALSTWRTTARRSSAFATYHAPRRAGTPRTTRSRCSASPLTVEEVMNSPHICGPLTRTNAARRPAARPPPSSSHRSFAKRHGSSEPTSSSPPRL